MLVLDNLSVSFRDDACERIVGLSHVNLNAVRGEVLMIAGASGAGKSLIAHAILGLLPADATITGHLSWDGVALTPATLASLRGRTLALVPQSIAWLDPLMRSYRSVELAARRAGLSRAPAHKKAHAMLDQLGLSAEAALAFPHALSGGMARRVLLAAALVADPELIVADEPTNGLDADNVRTVLRLLRAQADDGKAVIVISHDFEATLTIADRVAVLHGGTLAEVCGADAFSGDGQPLNSAYAKALWHALPANGFVASSGIAP